MVGTDGRRPALNLHPRSPETQDRGPNLRRPIPVCTPVPFSGSLHIGPIQKVASFTRWPDSHGTVNTETGLCPSAGRLDTQTSGGTLSQSTTAA